MTLLPFYEPINIRAENVERIEAHAKALGLFPLSSSNEERAGVRSRNSIMRTDVFATREQWQDYAVNALQTVERLAGEAPERGERARLLAAVTAQGFIDDYSGVRISKSGRRFRIARATVWNLVTERGEPCGQAATFSEWEPFEQTPGTR